MAKARSIARAVAVHEMLAEMARLPRELGLAPLSSFELLDDILRETVLEDRLLRAVFIDFVKEGEELLQVVASINWKTRIIGVNDGEDDEDEIIDLGDEEDFEYAIMRSLRTFRSNIAALAKRHRVDSADWSILLIDRDGKRARSDQVRKRHGIGPVGTAYKERVQRFEERLAREGGIQGGYSHKSVSGASWKARSLDPKR